MTDATRAARRTYRALREKGYAPTDARLYAEAEWFLGGNDPKPEPAPLTWAEVHPETESRYRTH